MNELLIALSLLNVNVIVEQHKECDRPLVRGFYQVKNNKPEIHLCSIKTERKRQYVLRHEAAHLAQDCYNGSTDQVLRLLNPSALSKRKRQLGTAADSIERLYRSYGSTPQVIALELEAHWLAANLTNKQVAQLVTKVCR